MKIIVFLITSLASFLVAAAAPYELQSIMLLQPESVIGERVPSVDSLSKYIRAIQAATGSALGNEAPSPASGYIVLAVRPGGESNVWFDFQPALPEETESRLRAAILAVPPFAAKSGTVVFALNVTLWDAPPVSGMPNPSAWRKAAEGHSNEIEVGDLVDKVWPRKAGT